jgi:uronate dehydrogenase
MSDKPILLTGAAGRLGRWLRPRLIEKYGSLRCSDLADMGPTNQGEELVPADLASFEQVSRVVAGTRAIIHFGAYSVEAKWETILLANIIGTYNVYEAARLHGVRRIIFASSNHAIGFHPIESRLDATDVQKPDGYYGVSKAFGENMGSLYVDKFNMEVACLRIGSALPEPNDPRHLSTWLSYMDLLRLVIACLDAPKLGFAILYGASNNKRGWWDNSKTPQVAFKPQDNAEDFAKQILSHGDGRDPKAPSTRFMGGPYCDIDYLKR